MKQISSPHSPRKIGLLSSIFLVASVMIGNGIYTSLGIQLLSISSGFGILALWAVAGLVALCGALCYAEIASQLPHSGGDYYYLTHIYHPAIGTMAGVITLVAGFVAPIALASMAFGKYVEDFLPGASPMLSSMLLVTIITMFHLLHWNVSVFFQNALTTLKFLLITGIILVGFHYARLPAKILLPSQAALQGLFDPSSGVVLLFCFYAYSGWNSSIYIADDITSSRTTVGWSLVIGTLCVTLLYLLLNTIFLLAVPMDILRGKLDVGTIVATHLLGPQGGRFMAALVAIGLVSGVSGMIWIGPRMTQMMGRDLFALRWLAPLSRNRVPVRSTLLQYVLTMIVLTTGSFKAVLLSTQVPVIFCSLLGVLGVIVLRRRRGAPSSTPLQLARIFHTDRDEEAAKSGGASQNVSLTQHPSVFPDSAVDQYEISGLGFRSPLYPLPSLFFAILSIVALVYTTITNPLEAGVGMLIILGALGCYTFFK